MAVDMTADQMMRFLNKQIDFHKKQKAEIDRLSRIPGVTVSKLTRWQNATNLRKYTEAAERRHKDLENAERRRQEDIDQLGPRDKSVLVEKETPDVR